MTNVPTTHLLELETPASISSDQIRTACWTQTPVLYDIRDEKNNSISKYKSDELSPLYTNNQRLNPTGVVTTMMLKFT